MKLHNGNLIVLRTKNPFPKEWPGPWFKFGNPGNITGQCHWTRLHAYIGKETARVVFKRSKCLKGFYIRLTDNGIIVRKKYNV